MPENLAVKKTITIACHGIGYGLISHDFFIVGYWNDV
jgi:hypothetical protein